MFSCVIRVPQGLQVPQDCQGPQDLLLRTSFLDYLGLLGKMEGMEQRANLDFL